MSILDDVLRNQILIERYKARAAARLDDLVLVFDRIIRKHVVGDDLATLRAAEIAALLFVIQNEWNEESKAVLDEYDEELLAFLILQARTRAKILSSNYGGLLTIPDERALIQAYRTAPTGVDGVLRGKTTREMLDDWSIRGRDQVLGYIRSGAHEGATNSSILRSLRGTVALRRKDGVFEIVRRAATATSNTAVQHVTSIANEHSDSAANMQELMWVAKLEGNTCARCRSLDGQIFKVGKGPRPPAHMSCRCLGLPLPAGWKKIAGNGRPMGHRDVDAGETYYTWLSKQPQSFVYDVLGKTRGELFLSGGISAKRFGELQLDRNFQPLTLDELRLLVPRVFDRAGV